ncbi:MAG: hypothetical protein LBJ00_08330 [Planctomycetaceae bacterium]|jgi:hypothetical protein|nr:hypothetical protein [Planctomycetaceae bacterium]
MLIKFSRVFFICVVVLFFVCPVFSQGTGGTSGGGGGRGTGGGTGNIGGGTGTGTGTGIGSGSGYYGGSTSTGSSSTSSSGISSDAMSEGITSPVGDIEFQDFTTERSDFIGVDTSVKFIGTEDAFDTSNVSSARRTTSTTSRTTTRSTAGRRTATGGNTQGSNSMTNGGRAIASTASFEPDDITPSANKLRTNLINRQSELKTKISRLPNLKSNTEKFNVSVVGTPSGVVAELTGVVRTEREGKILRQLLLLEPGIDYVKSDLKIEPAASLPKPN